MKLPVEYVQVVFSADEAPSALRLWLSMFDGKEPTNFATDEDGDTTARGPLDGYWLDIHNVNNTVNLYATRQERKTSYDNVEAIDDNAWPGITQKLVELSCSVSNGVSVERVAVSIVAGRSHSKTMDAIGEYRGLGEPFSLLPPGATDARYEFGTYLESKSLDQARLRRGLQYRVGRRALADPDGDYQASDGTAIRWRPHLGQVITTSARMKNADYLEAENMPVLYNEIVALASEIWKEGFHAFA